MSEQIKISPYKKKVSDPDIMDSPGKQEKLEICSYKTVFFSFSVRIDRPKRPESITPRNMQIASVRYKPAQSPGRKAALLQRSHTDISIKVIPKKNVQNEIFDSKKRTYDPEMARKFIQEQKIKRKVQAEEYANEKNTKEEIKKRLEDLQKNSRRILSDNVNKRKRSSSAPRSMITVKDQPLSKDKVRLKSVIIKVCMQF